MQKKYLLKVLSIDKNNYIALKYYESITMGEEDADEVLHQKTERKKQEVSYSRPTAKKESRVSTSVMQVAYVIFFGVIIGLAVAIFLINPGKVKGKDKEIDDLNKEITSSKADYEKKIDTLTNENGQLKADVDEKTSLIASLQQNEVFFMML